MINSICGTNFNNVYGTKQIAVNKKTATNSVRVPSENLLEKKSNVSFGSYRIIRTEMTPNEKKIYSKVASALPQKQRFQIENLLRRGILLDSRSNDNTTVLDNLNKILEEKRARGLDKKIVLSELVNTLNNPFVITQKFGDIPDKELIDIIKQPGKYKPQADSKVEQYNSSIKNVHSCACVAASIEFDLATKQPAEFARIANGLTSENICAEKKLKMTDIAPSWTEASWFLNEFKSDYVRNNWDNITVKMAPDRNAIVRARIQMTNKDPNERSLIDVLMQSTFMNIGSQQTYNSLTDNRTGKFNTDNTGLTDIEKSFAEAVSTGKNKYSITYQQMNDDGFITGYECGPEKVKKHITDALKMGENVIIGYTQQDENGKVINGHEITIVAVEKDENGKEIFVCNDTDDESDLPVRYYVNDLLPAIHHAGLPKEVLKNDKELLPSEYEAIDYYKSLLKNNAA
ncbi:hypothetical protein IJS77_05490 [bacterium]|nr:hypothetical protein [bacterium]